ncbi:MAG: IS30 family transposase, partial [Candidatus Micrarchaeaceae archaeon]
KATLHEFPLFDRTATDGQRALIQQYLPKGVNMDAVSQQDCSLIAHALNHRPRKRLGFRTPEECFDES